MNKKIFFISILSACFGLSKVQAQQSATASNAPAILVDNDKIRITAYTSLPGTDVCGKGMHTHADHGNILLTDAMVKVNRADGSSEIEIFDAANKKLVIDKDGKKQTISTEGVVWATGETHSVINIGKKPMKFYIIEVK